MSVAYELFVPSRDTGFDRGGKRDRLEYGARGLRLQRMVALVRPDFSDPIRIQPGKRRHRRDIGIRRVEDDDGAFLDALGP